MFAHTRSHRLAPIAVLFLPIAWLAFSAAGCNSKAPPSTSGGGAQGSGAAASNSDNAGSQEASTADEVLQNMARAYRRAKTYQDSGRIHFRMTLAEPKADAALPAIPPAGAPATGAGEDRLIEDDAHFSVTFVRPNKLRAHIYKGNLICDGTQLRGLIDELDGEVLALPAPETFTLEAVYADAVLERALIGGIAGASVQLLLLMDANPLEKMLDPADRLELMPPGNVEERPCYRVRTKRTEGELIFSIDQKTYELRRIDFPIEPLRQHFSQQGEIKSIAVWADFQGARLDGPVSDDAFQIDLPPNAQLVKQFDARRLNPPPPPPSQLLGKPAPELSFTDLAGEPVTLEDLKGQVVVLDFWFTTCDPCRISLPDLEQVYQKFKEHPKVRFLAVSVDPDDVTPAALRRMFADLKVNVPIVRDHEGKSGQRLGVEGCPTLYLLGTDGTVQHEEVGVNPALPTLLAAKIEKLIEGKSVFEDALREYQERKAQYEQSMKEPEVPQSEIAARSEPKALKLLPLWNCTELKLPGNILVVNEGGTTRLWVNDGWNAVAELGLDGKVIARHDLKLGEEDVVAYLRTAVDGKGRRFFLGLANSRPQVFLFDEKWQRLTTYPEDRDHQGIADGLLSDLDGDGQLEMQVSYWGVVGVQNVSLAGKRLWGNRALEHVFRLVATPPDAQGTRKLLCVHGQGTLVAIDHEGSDSKPMPVGSRFLRYIASADLDGDGQLEYVGIAANNAASETIVGFSLDGKEHWTQPIPGGVQQFPVEMISAGQLTGNAQQWIAAGPDGSLSFISAEGELLDRFNYGAALAGVAVVEIEGRPALLISTPQGIEALSIGE